MPPIVTQPWSQPSVSLTAGSFRATEVFEVSGVSSKEGAVAEVYAAYPWTVINSKHIFNQYMYSRGGQASPKGFGFYRVSVDFESTPDGRFFNPGAPLSEPIRWSWETIAICESTDKDNAGRILLNAAGEPFSSDFPTDITAVRLCAIRNVAYFDAQFSLSFSNSVNNSTVSYNQAQWTVNAGQSKVVSISPMSDITSATPYVSVKTLIELRGGYVQDSDGFFDGFRLRITNQGRRGWCTVGGQTITGPIAESVGNGQIRTVSQDVLLDKDGKPIDTQYMIASGGGLQTPVANPSPPPNIYETSSTSGVVFIKAFPDGVKIRDHNSLGLS